jgi:thymidine phosphorylase
VLFRSRSHAEAPVDPAVGFVFQKKPGDSIAPNDVLVEVHGNDGEKVKEAMARLETAFEYSTGPVEPAALIVDQIRNL